MPSLFMVKILSLLISYFSCMMQLCVKINTAGSNDAKVQIKNGHFLSSCSAAAVAIHQKSTYLILEISNLGTINQVSHYNNMIQYMHDIPIDTLRQRYIAVSVNRTLVQSFNHIL